MVQRSQWAIKDPAGNMKQKKKTSGFVNKRDQRGLVSSRVSYTGNEGEEALRQRRERDRNEKK